MNCVFFESLDQPTQTCREQRRARGAIVSKIRVFQQTAFPQLDGKVSSADLIVESGPAMSAWSGADTMCDLAAARTTLEINCNQHVVIGRQQGGTVEYLDPRFQPTRFMPNSVQALPLRGDETDRWVSRGHLMLQARSGGILLINGVPRPGGGIRPPVNRTFMLRPDHRYLKPGEEFLIETGKTARIRLPNGTVLSIRAN